MSHFFGQNRGPYKQAALYYISASKLVTFPKEVQVETSQRVATVINPAIANYRRGNFSPCLLRLRRNFISPPYSCKVRNEERSRGEIYQYTFAMNNLSVREKKYRKGMQL